MESPAPPKTPSLLRQQAEYCRRLAAGITNNDVRRRLLALAKELEKQATPRRITRHLAISSPEGVDPMPLRATRMLLGLWVAAGLAFAATAQQSPPRPPSSPPQQDRRFYKRLSDRGRNLDTSHL
jgi:hypothetical protein